MSSDYEFLIQDSQTQKTYDVSEIISGDVSWETQAERGASKLTFSYEDSHLFPNGSVVRFKYKNFNIFYGFIFKVENSDGTKSVTAYDSLRYFKYKDTKIIKNTTLGKLVKSIVEDKNLRAGTIEDNGYILKDRIEDNKTYLDMIYDAISDNLLFTGYKYILYDNFGSICLREAEQLKLPLVIGDESLATGYSYEKSIDGETYNRIKLAQDNKNTGTRETYISQDSASMARWGVLQYYDKVDEDMNSAQIKEKADKLLKYYNREEETFNISSIGDYRVRGGSGIYVDISELNIKKWCMVKKATHTFGGKKHTMELELIL